MPLKYFGRKNPYLGKSLWDIVCQLPNYGKGRIVLLNSLQALKEPSFMRIVEAKPCPGGTYITGTLDVHCWHRGKDIGVIDISKKAFHTNHSLIPREDEAKFVEAVAQYALPPKRVLPNTLAVPPLLKLFLEQRDGVSPDRIPLTFNLESNLYYRQQLEDEEEVDPSIAVPNAVVDGLGTPVSPRLYEGIDITNATHPPPDIKPVSDDYYDKPQW